MCQWNNGWLYNLILDDIFIGTLAYLLISKLKK
ncbi:hypothetical protein HMPREF9455_00253 [Dysgonomonas gadei ATCC BAA-286]|uniref:Uncharacterized protein n=1 Tax=Dysgonomonas gadei ATCC BAA-286 TaxID=742766 RepID=F5IT36_9BACT|nr:hypothetical protein HMPREF9455_00253 [Dysgonomonas gadei ATCC BAA-286]